MLVQRVLEARGEVDLGGLDRRKAMEQLVGQRRGPVLDGAGQPVLPGDHAEPMEDVEVQLHLGDRAVRHRHPAVGCAGLDADLADADGVGRASLQLGPIAVEVGDELLLVRVLLADLADLAADADRHAVTLEGPDERGQLGGADVVLVLLGVPGRLRQVDQGRAVDVDVPVAGVDREPAGPADLLGHRLRVGRVLLGVELIMIPLEEDRATPACGDGARENRRRVVDRPLVGVGLLAPGELDDDRPDVGRIGRLVDRPRHVERLGADVDRGHGEAVDVAAGPSHVQLVDAGAVGSEGPSGLVDQPLAGGDRRLIGAERRRPRQVAGGVAPERLLVIDDEAFVLDVGGAAKTVDQVGDGFGDVRHGVMVAREAARLPRLRASAWSPSG